MSNSSERRIGVARVLNKAGLVSRSQAEKLVLEGRVQVNGRIVLDPEHPTTLQDLVLFDGNPLLRAAKVYVMLNKPKGLVTTASDEKGRDTVFQCLQSLSLPHVGPVGRLDKASEGLLFFTNDTEWANALLDPANSIAKTYHVQVNQQLSPAQCKQMMAGIKDDGEVLCAKQVSILRAGTHNCWLEVVLTEGKNREIRRMLASLGVEVLRLIRISMGGVELGELQKGQVRHLSLEEVAVLGRQGKS